jgi:hypothetical protein
MKEIVVKQLQLFVLIITSFIQLQAQENSYDLSVGTTRYYDGGQNYGWIFLGTYRGIEEILGDTLIEDRTYAVLKWKAEEILDMEDDVTFYNDTSYYRFDDGLLYKYTSHGDSVVQDFTFSTGDTICNFYSNKDLASFISQPPVVTIYDTVVNFTDGTEHYIVWGDDTTHIYTFPTTIIPDKKTFMDSILIDRGETWLLPFGSTQSYFPYKPFYFIDSLGILYSEWNYRKMALVGVKKSNGILYGQEVNFITNIDKKLKQVYSFVLYQNYPNPFNPETQIVFRLNVPGKINVSVFNVLGQKISTLFEGEKTKGRHTISFNAQGLPSGIYFYRITSNEFSSAKKMLYVQ